MTTFAIIGSRAFTNRELVSTVVTQYVTTDDLIVSGGAAGPDTFADEISQQLQCRFLRIPAQWRRYGRAAGHRRNPDIIREASRVIAFWDGRSKGTKAGIQLAQDTKKAVLVVYPDGRTKSNEDWSLLYD